MIVKHIWMIFYSEQNTFKTIVHDKTGDPRIAIATMRLELVLKDLGS